MHSPFPIELRLRLATGSHHFFLIDRNDHSREEFVFVNSNDLVNETVDTVPTHPPHARVEQLVALRIGSVFLVSDHRVSGDRHRISTDFEAFGVNAIVNVVVFPAPTEEPFLRGRKEKSGGYLLIKIKLVPFG